MVSRRASGLAEVVGIQGVSLDHSDIDPIQNHAGFRASGIGSPLSSASPPHSPSQPQLSRLFIYPRPNPSPPLLPLPLLVLGLESLLGVGNGNPLQYSCLDNLMDRGVWRATVHRVTKGWT